MITKADLKYLRLAEEMAKCSDFNRVHIGTCLVKKNSVLSTGCNKNKTHPAQEYYNNKMLNFKKDAAKLHAEIDCLIKIQHYPTTLGSTLYIFRRGRDGIYRMSKPCPACMQMIKDKGIARIVYTIDNGIKEINLE